MDLTPFELPQIPIIGNVNVARMETIDSIREELGNQLTQSVRWTETIQAMRSQGITHFFEFGPKDVLNGLIKRIDREVTSVPVNSAPALQSLIAS